MEQNQAKDFKFMRRMAGYTCLEYKGNTWHDEEIKHNQSQNS
jgi:hypothetical protein